LEKPRVGRAAAFSASLVALGVAWMLYWVVFAAVPTFGPEWAGGGASGLLATSVITWVEMLGAPFAGAAIDRAGRPQVWCAAGIGVLAATLALMAGGALPAVAAMATLGLVAAVVPPAFYSLPARLVAAERVGFAFGFITALSNLGAVIGPTLAGAVRDATPAWAVLWGTLAGVALAGAVVAAFVRSTRPPELGQTRAD
jgi:MFS family permease